MFSRQPKSKRGLFGMVSNWFKPRYQPSQPVAKPAPTYTPSSKGGVKPVTPKKAKKLARRDRNRASRGHGARGGRVVRRGELRK